MEITFQSNKLQKIFSSPSSLLQKYGINRGKAIMRRISFIRSAQNLQPEDTSCWEKEVVSLL